MSYELITSISWVALLYSIISGAIFFKFFDIQLKLFYKLLIIAGINEFIALVLAYQVGNNTIVYGFYSPIEVLLLSYYFHKVIDLFGMKNRIFIVGVISCITGYVNYFIFQKPQVLNNFFLLLESISVSAMCLYTFYVMLLKDDDLNLTKSAHFWITSILMFRWTSTLCLWGTYPYITTKTEMGATILLSVLLVVNVITYLGFGTVFLLYKKMKTTHGR